MEKATIEAAAKGNIKAFKVIFDHYLPKLRPVALRYAKTDFEAEDILQESFIKIHSNLAQYRHEGSFDGWIRRIVVNTSITYYKKNQNFLTSENIENIGEDEFADEDYAEIEEADISHLMKIISELPDGYKTVFNLYVFEDYSHKEIADLLGISEGSSRSQYSKAKKYIKKIISRQRKGEKDTLIDSSNAPK